MNPFYLKGLAHFATALGEAVFGGRENGEETEVRARVKFSQPRRANRRKPRAPRSEGGSGSCCLAHRKVSALSGKDE